jgi:thiol-disulfide isomerase/thioredoxin
MPTPRSLVISAAADRIYFVVVDARRVSRTGSLCMNSVRRASISGVLGAGVVIAAGTMLGPGGPALAQATGQPSAPAKAAVTLTPGDQAPPLAIDQWLKGDAVSKFESGKVYVVEFWATWCGPCIASMPHLTKLQKQYKDQGLTIIGVTSEDPRNTLSAAQKMVADKADVMGFTVAWDKGRATSEAFMKAAGQRGIPCSFVVDKAGTLAFIGHPRMLDLVLPDVLAGSWDAKTGPAKVQDLVKRQSALLAMARKNPADAVAEFEKFAKEAPALAADMQDELWSWQVAAGDAAGASATGKAIVVQATKDKNAEMLNQLAWAIVDPDSTLKIKDVDLALEAALAANTIGGGKDAAVLDTLARAHFVKGDIAKAVATQEQAVAQASGEMKKELEGTLEKYRAAGK